MSVNKSIIVGNLGKDPELTFTPSGIAVCKFNVATSERFKNSAGEQQEKTTWHRIVTYRNLAEICGKYLTAGKQVYLEGKIKNCSYDDRDGNKKYFSEIIVDQMQMLGSKGDQQGGQNNQQQGNQGQQQQNKNQQGGFNQDDDLPY